MLQTPTLHLGSPTQIGPLTIFPVWTDAPEPADTVMLGVGGSLLAGNVDACAASYDNVTIDFQ